MFPESQLEISCLVAETPSHSGAASISTLQAFGLQTATFFIMTLVPTTLSCWSPRRRPRLGLCSRKVTVVSAGLKWNNAIYYNIKPMFFKASNSAFFFVYFIIDPPERLQLPYQILVCQATSFYSIKQHDFESREPQFRKSPLPDAGTIITRGYLASVFFIGGGGQQRRSDNGERWHKTERKA